MANERPVTKSMGYVHWSTVHVDTLCTGIVLYPHSVKSCLCVLCESPSASHTDLIIIWRFHICWHSFLCFLGPFLWFFVLSLYYMMFPLVLYPPLLRQCIAIFAVAEGSLLFDIGWFVLFFYTPAASNKICLSPFLFPQAISPYLVPWMRGFECNRWMVNCRCVWVKACLQLLTGMTALRQDVQKSLSD